MDKDVVSIFNGLLLSHKKYFLKKESYLHFRDEESKAYSSDVTAPNNIVSNMTEAGFKLGHSASRIFVQQKLQVEMVQHNHFVLHPTSDPTRTPTTQC